MRWKVRGSNLVFHKLPLYVAYHYSERQLLNHSKKTYRPGETVIKSLEKNIQRERIYEKENFTKSGEKGHTIKEKPWTVEEIYSERLLALVVSTDPIRLKNQ